MDNKRILKFLKMPKNHKPRKRKIIKKNDEKYI